MRAGVWVAAAFALVVAVLCSSALIAMASAVGWAFLFVTDLLEHR